MQGFQTQWNSFYWGLSEEGKTIVWKILTGNSNWSAGNLGPLHAILSCAAENHSFAEVWHGAQ